MSHRPDTDRHRPRRLRMEHCEQRRVLSATTGSLAAYLTDRSAEAQVAVVNSAADVSEADYYLAVSDGSGWVVLDADSDLTPWVHATDGAVVNADLAETLRAWVESSSASLAYDSYSDAGGNHVGSLSISWAADGAGSFDFSSLVDRYFSSNGFDLDGTVRGTGGSTNGVTQGQFDDVLTNANDGLGDSETPSSTPTAPPVTLTTDAPSVGGTDPVAPTAPTGREFSGYQPGPTRPPSTPATTERVADDSRFNRFADRVTRADDLDDEAPGRRQSARDPFAVEPTTKLDDAAPSRRPLRRVVAAPAPPAGETMAGAGMIDLATLLLDPSVSESDPASTGLIAGTAPAGATPGETARDAALAVESWVRAMPTPVEVSPSDATAPGHGGPTIGVSPPVKPSEALREGVSAYEMGPQAGVLYDRQGLPKESGTYHYVVASLTSLLGGSMVWVSRRQAEWRESGCVERPRRGDLSRS